MIDTLLRMTYLGDGISTDDGDSVEETEGNEGAPYAPVPAEEEGGESENPPESPDEA
jgi:hypothetical protein